MYMYFNLSIVETLQLGPSSCEPRSDVEKISLGSSQRIFIGGTERAAAKDSNQIQ
jgi:hypothetical protein